jgi:hypothetical protein
VEPQALANDGSDSPANVLSAAIRRGDMSAAIRAIAPVGYVFTGESTSASSDARFSDALAHMAAADYSTAIATIEGINATGTSAADRQMAHDALEALREGRKDAGAKLLADAIAGNGTETSAALAACATADATAWAADVSHVGRDDPPGALNALTGIRDFIVPLVGLTSSFMDSGKAATDSVARGAMIDTALEQLVVVASEAATQAQRLMPAELPRRHVRLSEIGGDETSPAGRRLKAVMSATDPSPDGSYQQQDTNALAAAFPRKALDLTTARTNAARALFQADLRQSTTLTAARRLEETSGAPTVEDVYRTSCDLSKVDGLSLEVVAEMDALAAAGGTEQLAALSGPTPDNYYAGAKCTVAGCMPYLESEAAAAFDAASHGSVSTKGTLLITGAWVSPMQQALKWLWDIYNKCRGAYVVEKLPGEDALEKGRTVQLLACTKEQVKKYGIESCKEQGRLLVSKGFVWNEMVPAAFTYAPKPTFRLLASDTNCLAADIEYLTDGMASAAACADACAQFGAGCTLFRWSAGSGRCWYWPGKTTCSGVYQVASPGDQLYALTGESRARSAKQSLQSLAVKAFQTLYNRNSPPAEAMEVDGVARLWDPATAQNWRQAPAKGWGSSSSRRRLSGAPPAPPPPFYISAWGPGAGGDSAELAEPKRPYASEIGLAVSEIGSVNTNHACEAAALISFFEGGIKLCAQMSSEVRAAAAHTPSLRACCPTCRRAQTADLAPPQRVATASTAGNRTLASRSLPECVLCGKRVSHLRTNVFPLRSFPAACDFAGLPEDWRWF